jgi:hypothetical protein
MIVPFLLLSFCDTILVRLLFFLFLCVYLEFGSQNLSYCKDTSCEH